MNVNDNVISAIIVVLLGVGAVIYALLKDF